MPHIPSMLIRKHRLTRGLYHLVLILYGLLCVLPVLLVFSISITGEMSIIKNGYSFIPGKISFEAYRMIFNNPKGILNAYATTSIVTVAGTALSVLVTSMLAYAISRRDYPLNRKTAFYVFFTMLFSGGLVPWYIVVTKGLHLNDTIFALFLPYTVIAWFVMLMKGFLSETPIALIESAKIDGASEYRIFFRLVLPLNKPGLATLALLCALMFWNDYWLSLMFVNRGTNVTLQLLLYRIMSNLDFLNSALAVKAGVSANVELPSKSARMAICILAAGPMMFVFPLFQKYFVKGLTVGAIKG